MAETDKERVDRELMELLNELRVVLPGVQVLFAFMLGLPFTQRFHDLTGLQRAVYIWSFLAAAFSAIVLMSPSAYHRLRFRSFDKEHLIEFGNRMAIVGMLSLLVASAGAVFIVTDVMFRLAAAAVAAAGVAVLSAAFWFVIPIWRQLRRTGATGRAPRPRRADRSRRRSDRPRRGSRAHAP